MIFKNSLSAIMLYVGIALCVCISINLYSSNNPNQHTSRLKPSSSPPNEKSLIPPSGSITGTATVCKDVSPAPEITFTGSGGNRPYTFTYTINGGANLQISTSGNDNSVNIPADVTSVGTFIYQLISVEDDTNDITTVNQTATITVTEVAVDFTFDNDGACAGTSIKFNSTVSGQAPYTYSWSFGDGSNSSNSSPTHEYSYLGCATQSTNITLTVTDANGCSKSVTKPISIKQKPRLEFIDIDNQFNPFNNCGNNTLDPAYTVNVGISDVSSCVNSFNIDWGDGTTATGISFPATHTYTQLGSFNMKITGNGTDCDNTVTYLVKNSSNPTGAIINPGNTVNLCTPVNPIEFAIGSWGSNPPDTSYYVDFGDGTIENYTQSQLESSSYYDSSNPANSQAFPIPHTYTETSCPSSFTVFLSVYTSCGQTNLTAGPIIILRKPEVDFEDPPTSCVNTAIQFENTSENGYSNNCTVNDGFFWDFGDGNTSTMRDPIHTYTTPGTYTISLYGQNSCGITDTITKDICIETPLTPSFTASNYEGCSNLNVDITNTTDLSNSCGGETYLWEIAYSPGYCGNTANNWLFTNGTDENTASPALQFDEAGSYTLTLTISNSCGDFSISETIIVKQPPIATINPIPDFCGTASIDPVAVVDNCAPTTETVVYEWQFPGGSPNTSNDLNPGTIAYNTPGDYQITLNVTTSCGTITTTQDFTVNELPTITNTNLAQTICSGTQTAEVSLTSTLPGTTYTWIATASTGVSGYLANGNTDTIPIQTIFNANTTAEDVIFTITPYNGICAGLPVDLIITVDPAPEFTIQPQSETICLNGPINDLTVTVNGAGTPTFKWYSNTTNDNTSGTEIIGETNSAFTPPNDTVGVIYYYVVASFTSGAGCNEIVSDIARIEVVDGIQISAQPISTQSICVGGDINPELSVMHSGGTGTVSYQWYSNSANSNSGGTPISGATANSYLPPTFTVMGNYYYYVTISLSGSGCAPITSEVAEITVVADPVITSQPIDNQSLCQGSVPTDLEVIVSGGIGTTYTYQWYANNANSTVGGTLISGANSSTYTPSTAVVGTQYYYVVINQAAQGCSTTSTISEVIINQAPTFSSQPISQTICFGETFNTLSIATVNGVGSPTYQWYSNTLNDTTSGVVISGETGTTFTPPSNTVGTTYYYVVVMYSSGGCSQIVSQVTEHTVNETPNIADKTDIICSGNAFNVSPTNSGSDIAPVGTTYTWSDPIVVPSGTVTGAAAESAPQNVISQTLFNTTTNPSVVTYTVTPTLGNCEGVPFEVEITVNPSISITSNLNDSLCYLQNGGSIEITIAGGIPFSSGSPYQIIWTGPNGYSSNTEDIFNLAPGNYILSILDNGGCPYSETFIITEPNELVFENITFNPETITCFGANDGTINLDIEGGTPPYTINWARDGSPYSTDEDLANLSPGLYEIVVSDVNNCGPITHSFDVIEPAELQVSVDSVTDVICFGDATGEIFINVIGGRPFETAPNIFEYSYSWIGPNGFSYGGQNPAGLIAGTYEVTVTDRSNCTTMLEVTVNQSEEIVIDYTATQMVCYGDNDASITINDISGGNPPYNVTWSNLGSGMSQNNLSSGTYTITVTDNTNCTKQASIIIEEPPLFTISPEVQNISCHGANDGRIILNLQGGINPVDLNWDDDSTAGVERNNLGPGTYTVTITDGKPCTISETFVISQPDPLVISGTTTDALNCDDANSGNINVIVTGGTLPLNYQWSNGATIEDLDNIPPGDYTINIFDANNCSTSRTFTINRFAPLEVTIDVSTNYDCTIRMVEQFFVANPSGGVPPYQINWSSGTISGANNEIMQTDMNGLVNVDVTDSVGCSQSLSYNVEIPVLGEADFDISSYAFNNFGFYSIEDPIQFTNTATGSYIGVSWDFGDGRISNDENPNHTYTIEGIYIVTQTVVYPFDCIYTKTITLIIEKGYKLIMPNAFTPNKDNLNDAFLPSQIALFNMKFQIYDTWGSMIFYEEGDTLKGWNGKIKDSNAENGNYYYTLSGETFYGKKITSKGAVVLIK